MEKKNTCIVLLGRAGCGKGTLRKRVLNQNGFYPITVPMSAALESLAAKPEIKSVIEAHAASGLLVPNTIVIPAFIDAFRRVREQKFVVIDGFPRDMEQYYTLRTAIAQERNNSRVIVVHLQTREAVCGFRLHARAIEEGRPDDNPESIARRMQEYDTRTKPMVDVVDRDASALGWEFFRLNGNNIHDSAGMFLEILHLPEYLKSKPPTAS